MEWIDENHIWLVGWKHKKNFNQFFFNTTSSTLLFLTGANTCAACGLWLPKEPCHCQALWPPNPPSLATPSGFSHPATVFRRHPLIGPAPLGAACFRQQQSPHPCHQASALSAPPSCWRHTALCMRSTELTPPHRPCLHTSPTTVRLLGSRRAMASARDSSCPAPFPRAGRALCAQFALEWQESLTYLGAWLWTKLPASFKNDFRNLIWLRGNEQESPVHWPCKDLNPGSARLIRLWQCGKTIALYNWQQRK